MELSSAFLGSIIPSAALFVEWKHPIEQERAILDARKTIKDVGIEPDPATEVVIANAALGSASVANLIITLIGSIAVVEIARESGHLVAGGTLAVTAVGGAYFGLLRIIKTRSFLSIATDYPWRFVDLTYRDLFSFFVYGMNIILLILFWFAWWITDGQCLAVSCGP